MNTSGAARPFSPIRRSIAPPRKRQQDILYQSPLTDEKWEAPPPASRKRATKTEAEPILIRTDFSSQEMEQMLTINDDEPLQDILKKDGKVGD